jgi:2-oxoglutarate dehydrogenase complex dehydrogenase (E1) component-like enzyme
MIFKCFRTLAPRFATNYTQAMFEAWKVNPDSVHEDWHHAFKNQQ